MSALKADGPAAAVEVATASGIVLGMSDYNNKSEWRFIPFSLHPAGGTKGLGAFANKAYKPGDLVFEERPLALLVVPDRDRVSRGVAVELIGRMVESLSPWRKACYFSLSQEERFGTDPSAVGIWLSNAYPMGQDAKSGDDRQAVFLQICRINHSCQPNVAVSWHSRRGRQIVRALKPLKLGEELTVSFYGADGLTGMLHTERQQLLQAKIGFHCQCTLCTLSGPALEIGRASCRERV